MRGTLLVWLAAGCGRIGFDPLGEGTGSGDPNVDGSSVVCPNVPQCPDRTSDAHIGETNVSSMVRTNHGLSSGMCSSGNGNPELAVLFTVSDDATYTISATPTPLAMYVQDSCCGGTELRCGLPPYTLTRRTGENFVVVIEAALSSGFTIAVTGN